MYRIMIVKSKRDNYETMYQYLTTSVDGIVSPVEINTVEDLDKKIEKMLNEDGYSKSDFIIVQVIDYTIDAKDYKNVESLPTPVDEDNSDNTENQDKQDDIEEQPTTEGVQE